MMTKRDMIAQVSVSITGDLSCRATHRRGRTLHPLLAPNRVLAKPTTRDLVVAKPFLEGTGSLD